MNSSSWSLTSFPSSSIQYVFITAYSSANSLNLYFFWLILFSSKALGSHLMAYHVNYNFYSLYFSFPSMNLISSPLLTVQNLSIPVPESLDTLPCCTCLPFCLPLCSSRKFLCCWAQQIAWFFFPYDWFVSSYATIRLPSTKWNSFLPFLINILCLRHRNLCWKYLLFSPRYHIIYSCNKPNFNFSSHIVISSCQILVWASNYINYLNNFPYHLPPYPVLFDSLSWKKTIFLAYFSERTRLFWQKKKLTHFRYI